MREKLEEIRKELSILEYWFSAVYNDKMQVERVKKLEKICDYASVDEIEQIFYKRYEETEFQKARRIMRETLLYKDEGLYLGYQANVAMLLLDEQNKNDLIDFRDRDKRNVVADKILKLIFDK